VPAIFDEIVSKLAVIAKADFAPLSEPGLAERTDLTEGDPYQADSLHAQAAFEGAVAPETCTHDSSQQWGQWFERGLTSGDTRQCDTFAAQ
jgi:uncharacterized protein